MRDAWRMRVRYGLLALGCSSFFFFCQDTSQPGFQLGDDDSSEGPSPSQKPQYGLHPIQLTAVATGFRYPISPDHHYPSHQLIMSVNYPTGKPYNFELVSKDGKHTQFGAITSLTEEVKLNTIRPSECTGGFQVGEMFGGNGNPGEIVRISADGRLKEDPWLTLPGEDGLMRGSLFQDRYCAWGGHLLVVTTTGHIWRVNAARAYAKVASLGTHLEGLTTAPNDPEMYGPWAGKLLVGAEQQGCLYAVDPRGNAECYKLGMAPEDIDIIPANENFFGVDYAGQTLYAAPPSEFEGMIGQVLVAQESGGPLFVVKWDTAAQTFRSLKVAQVAQWEHVTFSPAGILQIPPTEPPPEPEVPDWEDPPADYQPIPGYDPTLLATAQSRCEDTKPGEIFVDLELTINLPAEARAVLSATPNGGSPIQVEDGLSVVSAVGRFDWDFANGCQTVTPAGPMDITSILVEGDNRVKFQLYNLCDYCDSNTNIYLSLLEKVP